MSDLVEPKPKRAKRRQRRYFGQILRRREVWCIRIRHGTLNHFEVVGPDRSLAETKLARIREALERERALGVKEVAKVSLAAFWPTLEPVLRARHEATTVAADVGRFKTVAAYFGEKPMCEITPADVGDFCVYLKITRKFKPASLNRYMSLLSVAFQEATARSLAGQNPVRGIKRAKEELHAVPYLSAEDLGRIIARVAQDVRPYVQLVAETGLRRSEAIALEWPDLDLGRGALVIRPSKNKRSRVVPLTPLAQHTLALLRQSREPHPLVGGDPIFPGLRGRSGKSKASKAFKAGAKLAGFAHLRLHDFRHAWASGLSRAGVAPGVIGTLLGDTSPSVIYRYSKHAPKGAEAEAVGLLATARGQTPVEISPMTAGGAPKRARGTMKALSPEKITAVAM